MLLNEWWTGRGIDEDRVTIAEEAQITALLNAGVSVICDATHLHPPHLRKWAKLATRMGVEFEVVDVHADPAECRKRVYQRWCAEQGSEMARYLDPAIVDKQAKRFPVEKWPTITAKPFVVEPVEFVEGLPWAILCDIDGTAAHIPEGGRSPYDYSRVSEDEFDFAIRGIVNWMHCEVPIIFLSGRDDSCYDATFDWLKANHFHFDQLIMRPADAKDDRGNKLPDYQVKYDLFNKYIRGQFNVLFVLDDRQQVVDMWRSLGLKCLQVDYGDF